MIMTLKTVTKIMKVLIEFSPRPFSICEHFVVIRFVCFSTKALTAVYSIIRALLFEQKVLVNSDFTSTEP